MLAGVRDCTWLKSRSKPKVDEAYSIPRTGRGRLEHDVVRRNITVAHLAVHVHVVQSLQRQRHRVSTLAKA